MTIEAHEVLAEHAARSHLETCHPAVSVAYAPDAPRRAVLFDLQAVGLCRCPTPELASRRARRLPQPWSGERR